MLSLWSLSDSKSPQVSRTLLSILADLSNAVVWIVSTCLLISKFSSPLYQSFGNCTKSANYNWYHRHFHVQVFFFQFSSKVQILILLFTLFQFYSGVSRLCKVLNSASSFFSFFFFFFLFGLVVWSILGDPFVCQNPRGVSFFKTNVGLCIYYFLVWSNFNSLQNSQWIIVLYSFRDNLQHLLIM